MKLIVEIKDEIAVQYKDLKEVVHHELYCELHKITSEKDITVTELTSQTQEDIKLGEAVRVAFKNGAEVKGLKSSNGEKILILGENSLLNWKKEHQKGGK